MIDKKHAFGTAKVGEKGQIVIPKEVRDLLQIHTGDKVMIMAAEDGMVIIKSAYLAHFASRTISHFDKEIKDMMRDKDES